jgi:phenylpropionate dioxygenase-like ring-hydroxylating dioxygenase large terminal subunit
MMTAHVRNGPSELERSLPSLYYTAPEIFKKERDLILAQDWFCAGREEELPSPGNHIVVEVAGESILVVRTMKGELRAHYNVCRHRGARLCRPPQDSRWNINPAEGVTSANVIRCSYHQWTYNLEGELLGAPFLNATEGFCRGDFSLYPVGVDTWGGFFFLNLDPRAASDKKHTVGSQLGSAVERVARYPLAELQTGHRISYDVAANWKILMENYNECYHCAGVHPELCEIVPDFKRTGGSNLNWENGIPHREGAYTFSKTGMTIRAPFPGLSEEEKVRHKGELCFPNLMISLACDHVAAFLLWPLAPNRTRVDCRFLFHPLETAKPAFNPMDAVEFWDLVNRQDWSICEQVQAGVSSRVHKFGYYAPMEDTSLDIRNYIRERLGPLQPPSDL